MSETALVRRGARLWISYIENDGGGWVEDVWFAEYLWW